MKRHTATVTIVIALVALMMFAGVSSAQQTAASSGQSNTITQHTATSTTQDTTHTQHNIPGNDVQSDGCHHHHHHHHHHC
jgi:uncharacterized lipoprotein YajG